MLHECLELPQAFTVADDMHSTICVCYGAKYADGLGLKCLKGALNTESGEVRIAKMSSVSLPHQTKQSHLCWSRGESRGGWIEREKV